MHFIYFLRRGVCYDIDVVLTYHEAYKNATFLKKNHVGPYSGYVPFMSFRKLKMDRGQISYLNTYIMDFENFVKKFQRYKSTFLDFLWYPCSQFELLIFFRRLKIVRESNFMS